MHFLLRMIQKTNRFSMPERNRKIDLFAIATGLKLWHELLIAMFDVNASYWNILWGGFILLGAVVFGLGYYLLWRRKRK